MPRLSSLELMLDRLQQPEEKPVDTPPALPLRPVSRVRPRKPLPLDFDGRGPCSVRKRTKKEDRDDWKARAEKGICKIQRCYRGHQLLHCYKVKELRKEVIALQSIIRGEVARRGFERKSTSVRAIIIIQKQTRKYLHHQSDILHKQVLKTEGKLRGKREENIMLKKKLSEIEKKWEQYEDRMKSMEKEWQEQLIHIQECLVAANKKPNGSLLEIPINSNCVDERQVAEEQVCLKLRPNEELRHLKRRFKAWKKEYKNKLRDAQSALTKSASRNWWGRRVSATGESGTESPLFPPDSLVLRMLVLRMSDCPEVSATGEPGTEIPLSADSLVLRKIETI